MTPTIPLSPDDRGNTGDSRKRHTRLDRRRLLVGLAGAGGALAAAPVLGAALPPAGFLHGDEDHDDDHDDDRMKTPGGDDHDDRDDDHRDLDDDDIPSLAAAGLLEVHIIDDDEDGFFPSLLKVSVGDTVTFYNDDDKDHTATGSDWGTGTLAPGESAEVTFDQAGTFPYACQIHPRMLGTIEVGLDGTPQATPAATPEATGGSEPSVTIANFAFEPTEIEVQAGTTVTWTNTDSVPHTATALDGAFDTGTLRQGDEGSHTFSDAGRFEYRCDIHPNMTGVVIVT